MTFLDRERRTLDALLPGLDAQLEAIGLDALERPGSPGIPAFRAAGGPGLLVPQQYGGVGATALEAVRVQRAIGARSPSLAVASCMHHFSMASLVALSETGTGLEWMLMEGLARESKLMASGFAEGRTDQSILTPTMSARQDGGTIRLSGSKKPCSLSRSMDLLTASVLLDDGAGEPRLAVALIPADSPGIEVRPFWSSPILGGAESDEVVLTDVEVHPDLVVRTDVPPQGGLDDLQVVGFLWFEMLISAGYVGAASALVERVLADRRVGTSERARLGTEIEAAMALIEGVARMVSAGERGPDALTRALIARYAVQDAIARTVTAATELLGGMAFIRSGEVAYLLAASQALAFHPPSRQKMAEALADHFAGSPLVVA